MIDPINERPLIDVLTEFEAMEAKLRAQLKALDEERDELLLARGTHYGFAAVVRSAEDYMCVGLYAAPVSACGLRIAYDVATGGAKVRLLVGETWHEFAIPRTEGHSSQIHVTNDVAHKNVYNAWVYVFADQVSMDARLPAILSRHGRPPSPTP